MRRFLPGIVALVVLLCAAVALIGVELGKGALDYGEATVADPCQPRAPFPGDGFDATIQRIALDGLDGAACSLDTTREEFVLSFAPETGVDPIEWDRETIEKALRAGLLEAIDDAEERDGIPGFLATIMREVVDRAPLDWLIEGGGQIADLFN